MANSIPFRQLTGPLCCEECIEQAAGSRDVYLNAPPIIVVWAEQVRVMSTGSGPEWCVKGVVSTLVVVSTLLF